MRIRNKIAIIYTQLTFMVLLGSLAFVYVVTASRTDSEFYDQLWDRAMIAAQVKFEKDEMTGYAYRNLLDKAKFNLNEEKVSIFSVDSQSLLDSLKKNIYSDRNIRNILASKTIEFKRGNKHNIGIYYPDNEGNSIVLVSAIDISGAENNNSLFELLLFILLSSTILIYFIGLFYAKKVMSPIMLIINNVKRITANNLKKSLREERGNDELSELSRTFNNMIVRLRHSFDMQNSFIRNASHELRNPLTAILGETEIALSRPRTEQEYVITLETVLLETERLNSMIKDLLMLAQTDFDFSRIPKHEIDIIELLEELAKTITDSNINIINNSTYRPVTTGVRSLLEIAFTNVMGNASKFSSGKPVKVEISHKMGKIVIEIKDNGIGIPFSEMKHIMQPFYRAQNTSSYKGTGIGLALTERIISLHSGKLNISSNTGEGTNVIIIINDK